MPRRERKKAMIACKSATLSKWNQRRTLIRSSFFSSSLSFFFPIHCIAQNNDALFFTLATCFLWISFLLPCISCFGLNFSLKQNFFFSLLCFDAVALSSWFWSANTAERKKKPFSHFCVELLNFTHMLCWDLLTTGFIST